MKNIASEVGLIFIIGMAHVIALITGGVSFFVGGIHLLERMKFLEEVPLSVWMPGLVKVPVPTWIVEQTIYGEIGLFSFGMVMLFIIYKSISLLWKNN